LAEFPPTKFQTLVCGLHKMPPTTRRGTATPKKKPAVSTPKGSAKKLVKKKKADPSAIEDVAENASPESVASSPNAASFEPAPALSDVGKCIESTNLGLQTRLGR
jgi:hypothetical protein